MQIDVEKLKEETKKLSDLLNDPHVGSGSRFVPIAGDVQICNYVYPEQAREYAQVMGMTVVEP